MELMRMTTFWLAGGLLLTGTIGLCGREIQLYRAGESIISRRQLFVRMIGGVITIALVVKVMVGVLFVQPDAVHSGRYFVRYWLGCVGLAFLAVMVALVDACSVLGYGRKRRREISSGVGRLYATVISEAKRTQQAEKNIES
jgi:hypothetical protein